MGTQRGVQWGCCDLGVSGVPGDGSAQGVHRGPGCTGGPGGACPEPPWVRWRAKGGRWGAHSRGSAGFVSRNERGRCRFPLSAPGCPMWGVGGTARTHGGGVEGRGGPPRGSAGSHLPARQNFFPGDVPCPLRQGHDLPWPCHPCWGHEVCPSAWQPAGWILYGLCKGQAKAPFRSAALPALPTPQGHSEPFDLLSAGQRRWLGSPARRGCPRDPAARNGWQRVPPSSNGHSGARTHFPGGMESPWYPAVGWAGSAALGVDGWQGRLGEICPAPAAFSKDKSLILASWGRRCLHLCSGNRLFLPVWTHVGLGLLTASPRELGMGRGRQPPFKLNPHHPLLPPGVGIGCPRTCCLEPVGPFQQDLGAERQARLRAGRSMGRQTAPNPAKPL